MILPCPGDCAECETIVLTTTAILTPGPLPIRPTAHFQSSCHRRYPPNFLAPVKGLPQASHPCSALLWTLLLWEQTGLGKGSSRPLADPALAAVSLRASVFLS